MLDDLPEIMDIFLVITPSEKSHDFEPLKINGWKLNMFLLKTVFRDMLILGWVYLGWIP